MPALVIAMSAPRRAVHLFVLSLLLLIAAALTASAAPGNAVTVIEVSSVVKRDGVKPIGVNLGAHRQYGANQILKNFIVNPGFEPFEFSQIFLALAGATAERVQQDNWETVWTNPTVGYPVGFWNGAAFELLTGNAVGRSGVVSNFAHENNRNTYYLDPPGAIPATGSAVSVHIQRPGYAPGLVRFGGPDTSTTRPGSPGVQSLRLELPDVSWRPSFSYYFDTLRREDPSAGKIVIADGTWQFEIWARAQNPGDRLEIYFWRENEQLFWSSTPLPLTQDWQRFSFTFTVPEGSDAPVRPAGFKPDFGDFVLPYDPELEAPTNLAPILELALRVGGNTGPVWVDDMVLQRAGQTNPTVFSDRLVAALQELNPGILRNWGAQLGSSLDNQLASPFARRMTDHDPRYPAPRNYHYSLHEFLELCQLIGAEPWYVIPPTFTAEEMANLAAYLAAPVGSHPYADRRAALGRAEPWTTAFPIIHLEFGNEAWGSNDGTDAFIGATLRGGERVGELANNRFAALRGSPYYTAADFNLIIGGQVNAPYRQFEIELRSTQHNAIALAPYSDLNLTAYATDEQRYYPSFARVRQDVAAGPLRQSLNYLRPTTRAAIYEFNLHTTFGAEPPLDVRNDFVTGLNTGLSVPLYLLTYLSELGIRDLVSYQTLQYSTAVRPTPGAPLQYVRLWGMLRDTEATQRRRPSWLGVQLVNQTMRGELLTTVQTGTPTRVQPPLNDLTATVVLPLVQSFAFRDGDSGGIVLFNLHLTDPQAVQLLLPVGIQRNAQRTLLTAARINDDNEEATTVALQRFPITNLTETYNLTLPPHSLTVLEWTTVTWEQYLPLVRR